ncbi:proto-oncogene Mas-like [Ambystoma mexicanum]|uniref:proto-oncogene Mas-like n=1 Tax=Ambystoma mexicanum TaxID=8296 RepID=UPI0037E913C2
MIQLSTLAINTSENEGYNNNTESNSTTLICIRDEVTLATLSLLVSMFGLFGNGMVFCYLCFQIRLNKFTVYILNLCLADLMSLLVYSVLLVCMVIDLKVFAMPENLMTTLEVFFVFGYNTDLYLLTAISVERCLSVFHPIWYQCKRPKHQSAILCGLLWSLSCFVTLIEYFLCSEIAIGVPGVNTTCNLGLLVFMCLINFSIFIPLMVISNLILLIQIQRSSIKSHSSKLYIIILITVFVFLLSAVPPRVVSLLRYYELAHDKIFRYITVFCSSINSSSNPFIYIFVGSQKRLTCQGSMADVLQSVFKDQTETLQQRRETVLSTSGKTKCNISSH